MSVITLGDMSRYLRCPYEFQLDRRSGVWRITAGECMDMSVRDANGLGAETSYHREADGP